jgi:hypothetical protein
MIRPLAVVLLVPTVLVSGCRHESILPPDQDPKELVAAIGKRGQEPASGEPDIPIPAPFSLEMTARSTLEMAGGVAVCVVTVPLAVVGVLGYVYLKCREDAALPGGAKTST